MEMGKSLKWERKFENGILWWGWDEWQKVGTFPTLRGGVWGGGVPLLIIGWGLHFSLQNLAFWATHIVWMCNISVWAGGGNASPIPLILPWPCVRHLCTCVVRACVVRARVVCAVYMCVVCACVVCACVVCIMLRVCVMCASFVRASYMRACVVRASCVCSARIVKGWGGGGGWARIFISLVYIFY